MSTEPNIITLISPDGDLTQEVADTPVNQVSITSLRAQGWATEADRAVGRAEPSSSPAPTAPQVEGAEPKAGQDGSDYAAFRHDDLRTEVARRNEGRPADQQLPAGGSKADLAATLKADDIAGGGA